LISLLKNRQLNKFKKLRRFANGVYENRIRFGAVNECMWFCFMTFLVFGLWQIRDTNFPYTWSYANFAVAMFCAALCFGIFIWVTHLTLKNRHNLNNVPKKYKFILGDDSTLPYQMPLRYLRKTLLCLFIFSATI
jgi:hypothetical protein